VSDEESFRFSIEVPLTLNVGGQRISREQFFEWVWAEFGDEGLAGVHEGTVLSENLSRAHLDAEQGDRTIQMTTESWTVDSGEAPRDRDWVATQDSQLSEIYALSRREARHIRQSILDVFPDLHVGEVETLPPQDWNAPWKASFLADPRGVAVPPHWRIQPAGIEGVEPAAVGEKVILIHPGAGFGTGTHETTQLCLRFLAKAAQQDLEKGKLQTSHVVLDFGSGSGILAIAAVLAGYPRAVGVEIDPLAIENATENAKANQVQARVEWTQTLGDARVPKKAEIVFANILRPVLIQFSEELVNRVEAGGCLILSGLVEQDLDEVVSCFEAKMRALGTWGKPETFRLCEKQGDWRALSWRRPGEVTASGE
jgi:ribosomal protein L11 methyltransferase